MLTMCNCGRQGNVPDNYLGKSVRCPECGNSFVVDDVLLSPVESDFQEAEIGLVPVYIPPKPQVLEDIEEVYQLAPKEEKPEPRPARPKRKSKLGKYIRDSLGGAILLGALGAWMSPRHLPVGLMAGASLGAVLAFYLSLWLHRSKKRNFT